MSKIFLSVFVVIFSLSCVSSVAAQQRVRDKYGCETWEGEKWDPKYGRCMDADDYYDDDLYENKATSNYMDDDVIVYNWTKNNGLTTAKNFQSFRDESKITRDEVAVIVERALNNKLFAPVASKNENITFRDEKNIAKEFKSATNFVQNAGIMRGNNGFFYPKNLLTEYEALVIIARAMAKTEITNFQEAQNFAFRIRDDFELDDAHDFISRGDFFEMIKKAKENL